MARSSTASPTAAGNSANSVTITDAGPSRKKVRVEIPAAAVSQKLEESLGTLAQAAHLPGFRPGKAPKALIEKRFGSSLKQEAKQQLIAGAFSQAVEEHKLKVVGEPASPGLDQIEIKDGQGLVVDFEVEVEPEFSLPSLEGIEIRKPLLEVPESAVEEELEKIRVNQGELATREVPEAGDYITGRGVMKGPDGTEHYNMPGVVVQMPTAKREGKGMVLGILLDDLGQQLAAQIGGKPVVGRTLTLKARGPEGHEIEAVRGVELTITLEVERVDRIIPASMEAILPKLGLSSEQELKDEIRRRLTRRVEVQQQVVMRQQIATHLLEKTWMELPERLAADQTARVLENKRMELLYRGVEPAQVEEHMAQLRADSGATAVRELKLFFILSRAAQDLGVSVSEAEINGRIAQIALERGHRPEKLRQELIQQNRVGVVYQQIRDHKAMDAILAKAKITEVPAEEFNTLMEQEAKARGGGEASTPAKKPAAKAKAETDSKPAAKEKTEKEKKKK